jgi:16S rRNA processing protein RimM
VIVNLETDFPEDRFVAGRVLLVGPSGEPRRIEAVRFHQGRPIVALEGIDTIDAAEALAGADLTVAAESLPPLPGGTFYRHDLVGCEVYDTRGAAIGQVVAVEGPMEQSRLVVRGPAGDVEIPLAAHICVSVDPRQRRIVVDPPPGLIELNSAHAD